MATELFLQRIPVICLLINLTKYTSLYMYQNLFLTHNEHITDTIEIGL